jgi:2'-5' RNA ligase
MKLIKPLSILKDRLGNSYMGIKVGMDDVYPLVEALANHLGDDYERFATNRKNRDGENYHITVLNVGEYQPNKNTAIVHLGHKIQFEIKGIGKAEHPHNGNITYFAIVESMQLDTLVTMCGIKRDFHITLGFDLKDVFGVSKGQDSKIISI